MIRKILIAAVGGGSLVAALSAAAVPAITGEPIVVQHLGTMPWPQDDPVTIPYLTQGVANDINDLHGDVTCDLIISTPGNYHMALRDAMKGRPDLELTGLQEQVKSQFDVSVCWSTSPPVAPEQIPAKDLQFKNIHLKGLPALAMGPGKVMNKLVDTGMVDGDTRRAFLRNRGNVMLVRADKAHEIHDVCNLGGDTRVATPNPYLEPGSFGNFSGTIFNVADQNNFGCDATELFEGIFGQDLSQFDLSAFDNPYDIEAIQAVFTGERDHHDRHGHSEHHGKDEQKTPKWVASSRIMHRDIPYALCHNEADAGVIFYHQAKYIKETLGPTGCALDIVPMGGTAEDPQPVPGNKIGTLFVAKVNGDYPQNVLDARDLIYDFLTENPLWGQIMLDHGLVDPR
jgi:hypothetical protein